MRQEQQAELRQLAMKATPGPWEQDRLRGRGEGDYLPAVVSYGLDPCYTVGNTVHQCGEQDSGRPIYTQASLDDAAFIAAADPQTVLALIDEVERLQREIADLNGRYNRALFAVDNAEDYIKEYR